MPQVTGILANAEMRDLVEDYLQAVVSYLEENNPDSHRSIGAVTGAIDELPMSEQEAKELVRDYGGSVDDYPWIPNGPKKKKNRGTKGKRQ